ncbi:acyltransferase family protein [Nesterenkonia xinjiangensis]|uniref:Fucose 4-O-acetylase-like acetyltransferase n=1 Tax=Nesterenkonia xinjiangensis TaxID=225327 RepID=A0A7Z0GKR1_9MICC|nr:fucose 4-O-acetylase-like acetyltransferase [Nesterenkonia xinjiangensis]
MSPDPSPPVRDATLDIAKALAIILIVVGHVWRALEPAGLVQDPLLTRVDSVIYMSHLSVFAFVAGLFVAGGMRRDGPWYYARARTVTFLWLYTLWSTLQLLMKIAVGSAVNDPVSPVELLRIWEPKEQFWFFGWLVLMMLLTAATRPWRSRRAAAATWGLAGAGSLAVWGLNWNILGGEGLALTIFFFSGVVLTGRRLLGWMKGILVSHAVVVLLVAGAVWVVLGATLLGTPPTAYGNIRSVSSVTLGALGSLAGVVSILALSLLLARTGSTMQWLARIGQRSLVIFVAHVFFTAGTRIALSTMGIDALWIHVVGPTVIGVIGPLLIYAVAQRLRQDWVFEAPRWLRHLTGADRTLVPRR